MQKDFARQAFVSFHFVETLWYQIRLFSLYTLSNMFCTFSVSSQSVYWTFTGDGKFPVLQQTHGLYHLSDNNFPLLHFFP